MCATPAEPPNSPLKEGIMRLINRMVTASCVVVTVLSSSACESGDSTSPATTAPPEALRVTVSPELDTLIAGSTAQLTARVSNEQNQPRDHAVDWRSENPSAASVSSPGRIAAVSSGVARIPAHAGGAVDTATTVVLAAAPPIAITPGAVQVVLGDSLALTISSTGAGGAAMAA